MTGSILKEQVLESSYDFEIESTKPLFDVGNSEVQIQFGDFK